MTILSKIETLIEYAKFGMQVTKAMMGKQDISVELPRSVTFISSTYSAIHRHFSHISSKYPVEIGSGKNNFQSFNSNNSLKSIRLLKTLSIPQNCFFNISTLETVEFPSAETLGGWVFEGCSALKELNFPNVVSMGQQAIANSGVIKASFEKLESVGYQAFYRCNHLEELYLENCKTSTTQSFSDCPKLKKLVLGAVVSLPYSYNNSTELEYLGIGKGTTASISLYNNPKITQECLHQICENYANRTGFTAPTFWVSEEQYFMIDTEHHNMLQSKNINIKY